MPTRTYAGALSTRATPQSQPIPGSTQVPNEAGGYTWPVSDRDRFDRFLTQGSEGGTYYTGEAKLTRENAEASLRVIQSDGEWAVRRIVELSHGTVDENGEFVPSNRIMKNATALFLLAMNAGLGDENARRSAMASLPKVARTASHIETFYTFVRQFRGDGRLLRNGLARWFESLQVADLAYQAVKYQERDGVALRDLLRVSHPSVFETSSEDGEEGEATRRYSPEREAVYRWISYGISPDKPLRGTKPKAYPGRDQPGYMSEQRFLDLVLQPSTGDADPLRAIKAFEAAKRATTESEIVRLVRDENLPREGVPTQYLNSVDVWDALLHQGKYGMPITALIRNLAKMTAVGLIAPMSEAARFAAERLNDAEAIKHGRVHPIAYLNALLRYSEGKGDRGHLTWSPLPAITDALDAGFYTAFGAVEPTGKRILLAVDFSGSMGGGEVNGIKGLTPRKAAAAMALVAANTEPNVVVTAFTTYCRPLNISPRQRLDDVVRSLAGPGEGTDCAAPVEWALKERIKFDAVVLYTDGQTWAGTQHPAQAIRSYREKTGIFAKLANMMVCSNAVSLKDPGDAGCMDFVGFDTSAPNALSAFIRAGRGEL